MDNIIYMKVGFLYRDSGKVFFSFGGWTRISGYFYPKIRISPNIQNRYGQYRYHMETNENIFLRNPPEFEKNANFWSPRNTG